jgi:hypothetical protein
MKEMSDGNGGCVQNYSGRNGHYFYATAIYPGYVDEFPVGSMDDVRSILGANGDGGVLCGLYISTVH